MSVNAAEFEPSKVIELILSHTSLLVALKKLGDKAVVVLPKEVDRLKASLDEHLEDYVFEADQEDHLRRSWDNFSISLDRAHNTLKAEEGEFQIFSNFRVDTEALQCDVYLVEDYGESQFIDECKRVLTSLELTIKSLQEKHKEGSIEEMAQAVQDFYEDCEKSHANCIKDDSEFMEKVEAKVMHHLLPSIYEDQDAKIQDLVLVDKMIALEKLETEEDTKPFVFEADSKLNSLKETLSKAKEPKTKLEVLHTCVLDVCKLIEAENPSADLLIPALMYALIKVKPEHLISDLRFIQRFRNHSKLTGELAYNLTSVLAVVSVIEGAEVDKIGGETIYALVSRSASQLDVGKTSTGGSDPPSPSLLMRPLTEINAMASTVFTKVTFYPRALSAAVADSFRRSKTSDDLPLKPVVGSRWIERQVKHPDTGRVIEEDLEIRAFRHRVMSLEKYDELSVREIPMIFADYKKLLMTHYFEPASK